MPPSKRDRPPGKRPLDPRYFSPLAKIVAITTSVAAVVLFIVLILILVL